MTITRTTSGRTVSLAIDGRLDSITSIDMAHAIDAVLAEGSYDLVMDFAQLEYVSSAGLRVLIDARKRVNEQGAIFQVIHASDNIKKIIDITGISKLLNLK